MMYQETLEDRSIYYWLKEIFSSTPFVNIVDEFPEEDLVIPTIAVTWDELTGYEFELGNRELMKERTWYLDIFAANKTQKDEFAYKIFNELNNGVPVYDYNQGFPPEVTPDRIGTLIPVTRRIRNIKVEVDEPEDLYYRAVLLFESTYGNI
jgi:hypothetical protein